MPSPALAPTPTPILELRDVRTHFPNSSGFLFKRHVGTVKAVDGVTLSVARGEVLGLDGESGRFVPIREGEPFPVAQAAAPRQASDVPFLQAAE